MKILTLILILILSPSFVIGQIDYCKEFRTGVFQIPLDENSVYTVIRTDTSQFERNPRQAAYSETKIKWNSECYYTQYDRTTYRRRSQSVKDTISELGNIIYKFEEPNKYYVKTFPIGLPDTVEMVFLKLDTTEYHINLLELKNFTEYKDTKAWGQDLLDAIHLIGYYQNKATPNKYLITFQTTYHGERWTKSKLIDSIVVNVIEDEKITSSKCRINGEIDDEIVAIYTSNDQSDEATIIRAFRCNRRTEKIEEVDINTVQYKEAE